MILAFFNAQGLRYVIYFSFFRKTILLASSYMQERFHTASGGMALTHKLNRYKHGGNSMGSINRVFLMGNLTRNPELRKTTSGLTVSDLGLAVSEKYKNKAGEIIETVCFADVVVWGRQAETCGQYLTKGAPVMVEGRLQLDQWQTDKGEKRSRLRVRADRVQFLGRAKNADGAGEAAPKSVAVAVEEAETGGTEAMPF